MHPEWPPRPPTHPPTNDNRQAGVPRRFGIGSIMVVTAAFALLFVILRAIGAPGATYALSMLFIVVIGLAQALLFGGENPRVASILAGAVSFPLISIVSMLFAPNGPLQVDRIVGAGLCSAVSGALWGYLTGALIGGVFLLMRMADKFFHPQKPSMDIEITPIESDDSDPFGE